jgi:8-oxo-dGTP diphosphatase
MQVSGRPSASGRPQAVGAVLVCRGRVLLCRRSARRRWCPGKWDLPGGHVEPGETPRAALVRELREELGIRIQPPCGAPISFPAAEFDMHVWVMREWSGEIVNAAPLEHDEVRWFTEAAAGGLSLALSAYREPIARALAHGAAG